MTQALSKTVRLWHTLRPLRPVQVTNRVWRRVKRTQPHVFAAPPLPERPAPWVKIPAKATSQLHGGDFRFLNDTQNLDQLGWDAPQISKLWRYNLHYFDALLQPVPLSPNALIARWIAENPAGTGSGWEPYPTSLRLVNWVKFWLQGGALDDTVRASLAQQTDWLLQKLEWHLLGNHLFANGKALLFAALLLEGRLRGRALSQAIRILNREMPEQFLADGGQFERSPMYHALGLEDLLDLHNLLQACPFPGTEQLAQTVKAAIPAALHWMGVMTHPDGQIGLFNDAAFDIAPAPQALSDYGRRLGFAPAPPPDEGPTSLTPSGYLRLQAGPATAMLDCAPLGPAYLPGHAHADTLSFELSLEAQRVIVNGGTSVYGTGPERAAQRATRAHATVEVNGRNSSDVWAGFRVGRQAKPGPVQITAPSSVTCSHDGYRPCRHHRTWQLENTQLTLHDRLEGPFSSAQAIFPLHPDWVLIAQTSDTVHLRCQKGAVPDLWIQITGAAQITLDPSQWHPRFGAPEDNFTLKIQLQGPQLQTTLSWANQEHP